MTRNCGRCGSGPRRRRLKDPAGWHGAAVSVPAQFLVLVTSRDEGRRVGSCFGGWRWKGWSARRVLS